MSVALTRQAGLPVRAEEEPAVSHAASSIERAGTVDMRLTATIYAAGDVNLYEFTPANGETVTEFNAGAHVDVHLPNGLVRQYSMVNPETEQHRYLIAVKRDAKSRGGSRFMHDELRVGTIVKIGRPRNNFPLFEAAQHSVFIAGGIGITPIICMVQRARALGLSWQLHYAVRRRDESVFLSSLLGHGNQFHLHVDEEAGGLLDIRKILADTPPAAHLYCCGPSPMLDSFAAASSSWPVSQKHVEHFASNTAAAGGGFTIELAKSGRRLEVLPNQSILETLRAAGFEPPASCEQGICGSCETRVLSGLPDHRDMLLSAEERAENKTMMICCSGCLTDTLVLDL